MLKYLVLKNSLVINYKSKTYIITSDDVKYKQIVELIAADSLGSIPAILNINEVYANSGITTKDDGCVYLNGIPLDSFLSKN